MFCCSWIILLFLSVFVFLLLFKVLPDLCSRLSWSTAEWHPYRSRTGSHLCFLGSDGRPQSYRWSNTGLQRSSTPASEEKDTNSPCYNIQKVKIPRELMQTWSDGVWSPCSCTNHYCSFHALFGHSYSTLSHGRKVEDYSKLCIE